MWYKVLLTQEQLERHLGEFYNSAWLMLSAELDKPPLNGCLSPACSASTFDEGEKKPQFLTSK